MTTMKPLPSAALLESTGSKSVGHFFLSATAGLHQGKKQLKRPMRWQDEETSEASLAEPLRILLSLVVERFDAANAGVLTVKELKKRLPWH